MTDRVTTTGRRHFSVEEAFAGGDPYPHYAWFRNHDPVHVGEPGWPLGHPQVLLFRHDDVLRWLKDPRMLRTPRSLPEFLAMRKEMQWEPPAPDTFGYVASRFMLFQDPPDHTRLRGLANRAFTPRVVADRRGEIEAVAADLLRAFREERSGEGDLVAALAYPLPVMVIASVLGIPREDMSRFREWAAVVGAAIDVPIQALADFQARADDSTREMCQYLRHIIARRRDTPADDLITRLIAARDEEGRLTDDELIATCVLLMIAGHETTVNLIANGTLALLRHRNQWERLVSEPDLAGNATEELLRYDSPVQFTGRIAAEDVEIGGVGVRRGAEVLFMLGSANRDAAVWDQPDEVRIDRQVGRHLSFGMGIHFCLGAPLARIEGEVAFRALAREAPGLELVDPDPAWRPGAVLHGLRSLEVRLGHEPDTNV
jgi:cytochrome P450